MRSFIEGGRSSYTWARMRAQVRGDDAEENLFDYRRRSAIKLDAKRAGEVSLVVTNTSVKPITGPLKVRLVEAPGVVVARPEWLAPARAKFTLT